MNRFVLFALIGSFLAVGAGMMFLLSWDIPAPSEHVERELSDDTFPK